MRSQVFTGDTAHGTRGAVGVYAKTVVVPPCATANRRLVDWGG